MGFKQALRRSFRFRLLISFVLPTFILIPLMGLAIIYLMENQVFLPALSREMTGEGNILSSELSGYPQIWQSPASAQAALDRISLPRSLQVDLLDTQANLLASNNPSAQNDPEEFSGPPSGDVLNIVIPVTGPGHRLLGRLRLTRRLADLDSGIREAREWIIAALLLGILVNTLLGWILSARFTNPLRQVTQAITGVAPAGVSLANASPTGTSVVGTPGPIPEQEITELNALAQAFNQLQERRSEIETTRQQMLANLVHELGRPLGSLQAAVHALLAGAQANDQLRMDLLQGMAVRIETLGHLVNDLTLAYIPHRALELHPLPFQPVQWLNSMAPLWAATAQQKGIVWNAAWPEDIPPVEGDPDRLEQALGNLVSNALKFTPPGGRVSLSAGGENGQFWVSVADNGPGIAMEDLQHLFDPFFRAAPTALKAPGLGLGLSISRIIVEAHGGSINVRSQPGSGSVFTLCVPRHR